MKPLELDVFVRAWTTLEPDEDTAQPVVVAENDPAVESVRDESRPYVDLGPSAWSLTFDVETNTDLGQAARFLTWQEHHRGRLRTTGIAYEPHRLTVDEVATITDFCAACRLRCMTITDWILKVFYGIAWSRRGLVVGFNLPFDLSRLAISHTAARPRGKDQSMRGGWSFRLTDNPYLPRVQIKRVGARAAFIRFAAWQGAPPETRNRRAGGRMATHRGYFLDASIVGAAMLGQKVTLGRLAELLQTDSRKSDARHGAPITSDYLTYGLNDTNVTYECYRALVERYAGYRIDVPLYRIYSEAGIGKAHLRQMGIRPWTR